MPTYLITGATGLIGKALLAVIPEQSEVYALSRTAPASWPPRVRHIPCDLATDWDAADLPRKVDAVIHLAQSRWFRHFPDHAEDIFRVNVASCFRLLEYARRAGASRFVLASSGGVNPWENRCDSSPIAAANGNGIGFYLGSKLCGELLTENYLSVLDVSILRFYFVYGPGQRSDMLIPRLIHSVRTGRPIQLHDDQGITVNPTYVADAATALLRACNLSGSQKVHVGGPDSLSLRQIGETIGRAVGREPRFEVKPQLQPPALIGDTLQAQALIGGPMTHFAEGLRRMLVAEEAAAKPAAA